MVLSDQAWSDLEFLWNGCLEVYNLLGGGVYEFEDTCVQAKSVNGRERVAVTVFAITDYGVTDRGEVHTDLVGATCFEVKCYKGESSLFLAVVYVSFTCRYRVVYVSFTCFCCVVAVFEVSRT